MAKKRTINRRRYLQTLAGSAAAVAGVPGCGKTGFSEVVFPEDDWEEVEPENVGMSRPALEAAVEFLGSEAGEAPWHVAVVRFGRLLANHYGNIRPDRQLPMASLCKSVYTSMLGIAIAEGKIGSVDDRLIDYYPEIQGATGDFGPNPEQGRFFGEDDKEVTFRNLATNTGGFMRAGEPPGTAWTYDTVGMSALIHAVSKQYGYYDSDNPSLENGDGELIAQKIRDPIGASWRWKYTNFPSYSPGAKLNLFGHYVALRMNAREDLARLGLLWMTNGRWKDRQIIPADWVAQSTRVDPIVKQCVPEEKWRWGFGFWVNEYGRLWPNLPRDSYMAAGYPNLKLWVCPSLSLVVAASPALPPLEEFEDSVADARFLERITDAIRS